MMLAENGTKSEHLEVKGRVVEYGGVDGETYNTY